MAQVNLRDVLGDARPIPLDAEWVRNRHMVSKQELLPIDQINRMWTSNHWKFTDTRMGGNIGINPRPQFTRTCDIRVKTSTFYEQPTIENNATMIGMGRYYSNAIDDNAQILFLEPGIPKFNSLLNYFANAVSAEDAFIANYGTLPLGYSAGKVIGNIVLLRAFPLATIVIWGAQALKSFIFGNSFFNFYYLQPAPHMYWGVVNNLVTHMATELGILHPIFTPDASSGQKLGIPIKFDEDDMKNLKEMFPGIITENNYIDVFAIATRAQAIANQQKIREREMFESGEENPFDLQGYLVKANTLKESYSPGEGLINTINKNISFTELLKIFIGDKGMYNKAYKHDVESKNDQGSPIPMVKRDEDGDMVSAKPFKEAYPNEASWMEKFTSTLDASIRSGGQFVGLYVDYTGSVSDSFSNSTASMPMGDALKTAASGAKHLKFTLANGNIIPSGEEIVKQLQGLASGATDSITFGLSNVLQTLMGNSYVSLPKIWDDSDFQLGSVNYNIELRSPYNNPISNLQNLWIPTMSVLALVLPLSTGKSSYTSPFLVSAFSKGVQHIPLGIVSSVTITRGVSNLGWDKLKRPLGIDISISITDLSTIMTAPVSSSIFGNFTVGLSEDTPLSNYISTLASRDLLTYKYMFPKIKMRLSRAMMWKDQFLSANNWAMRIGSPLSHTIGGIVSDHSLNLRQGPH